VRGATAAARLSAGPLTLTRPLAGIFGVNQSLVPIVAGATGGDTGYGYSNYANTQVGWTAGGGME